MSRRGATRRRRAGKKIRTWGGRRMRRNDGAPRTAKRAGKRRSRLSHLAGPSMRRSFTPMSAAEASAFGAPKRRRGSKRAKKAVSRKDWGAMIRLAKSSRSAHKARRRAQLKRARAGRKLRGRSVASRRRTGFRRDRKRVASGKITAFGLRVSRMTKKRGASAGMRQIASAWRSARKASRGAHSAEEQAFLRAAGLGSIPNRSLLGPLKDFSRLLPQIGVGAGALIVVGIGSSMLGDKLGAMLPAVLAPHAPALVASGLTVGAYLLARNVKALAAFSLPIALGGAAVVVIQLLRSIKMDGVSLASKIGLPFLGEYTAVGEYTQMGSRPGHGDDDPDFVNGLDDEPDYADGEGLDDDEIGGIFDTRTL